MKEPVPSTQELIAALAQQIQPKRRFSLKVRWALACIIGIACALALLLLTVGVRPDIVAVSHTPPFLIKIGYILVFAIVTAGLSMYYAQPDLREPIWLAFLVLPIATMVPVVWQQVMSAPPGSRRALWMGHSALICPGNIFEISLPVLIVLIWTMRRMAPTRLRLAGFCAGVCAGASGAAVYALYCTEMAAPFILAWYTLGMLLPGLLGALFAPRILRW